MFFRVHLCVSLLLCDRDQAARAACLALCLETSLNKEGSGWPRVSSAYQQDRQIKGDKDGKHKLFKFVFHRILSWDLLLKQPGVTLIMPKRN